ncbi:zinc finger protein 626-like isoform X2 [Condylostylus longicornis]|uniref:zinc finger protein 626-like isoform X2 n=1 Tax=Condylostylus longicornis TaxID=2530218 RepID=UPI00244DFE1F|nr:zinc finger protein 626-like isoform X2 [Condylostylus longicornis]
MALMNNVIDVLDFESKLIDEIKKKPFLYQNASKGSTKIGERKSAWKEIQESLGLPAEVCKKKWESLKNSFRKFQRKALEKGIGINWIHYENLKLLLEDPDIRSSNDVLLQTGKKNCSASERGVSKKDEKFKNYKKCGEIMIHNKELKFICWKCQSEFQSLESFINHILKSHFDSSDSNSESECQSQSESCNETILDSNDMNTLSKQNKNLNEKSCIIIENFYTKNLDSKAEKNEKEGINEKSANRLYHHKKLPREERFHKCEKCDQSFRYESSLKDHFSVCHNDERPFSCTHDGCCKKFKSIRTRKLHEILHTKDLPFQCQYCGKCFPSNSYLIAHKNTWHVDKSNRRHKCQYCEKTFCAKQKLKFHTYTHTGERPYGCPLCTTRFTKPASVKEHMKIHLDERKYVCKACGSAFNQIASLIKHRKRHEEVLD